MAVVGVPAVSGGADALSACPSTNLGALTSVVAAYPVIIVPCTTASNRVTAIAA